MRAQLAAVVALATLVALAATALGVARSGAHDARVRSERIAEIETTDFRAVLTAARVGGGAMPTASVSLTTFEQRDGRWLGIGRHEVRGPHFWWTVTGRRAVCRLEIRTAGPGARFHPRAVVQLLAGPSLGCGRARAYSLTR